MWRDEYQDSYPEEYEEEVVSLRILLVEPEFPVPRKSKNHKNFLPIGLLKLATYLTANGCKIKLVRGKLTIDEFGFLPNEIWVTSLFTYWAKYVKECVAYYRRLFPSARIIVGGIYASLMPEHCKEFVGCDEVFVGIHKEADRCFPSYSLVEESNPHPIDYQIIHTSRGCTRNCDFCGTWKIEPSFVAMDSIGDRIKYRKLVFYDNNLLANPHIKNILNELIDSKKKKEILWCEAQSGFDGKKIEEHSYLGKLIKEAGFRYPRIAWDWDYGKFKSIKKQVDILVNSGYGSKDISVFMLYNWNVSFKEMENKRIMCWKWRVQIADCRYRPLNQTFDDYDPRKKGQTNREYYIHEQAGWTDELVKQFRKNIRRQNICVRHGFPFYSKEIEQKRRKKETIKAVKGLKTRIEKIGYLEKENMSYWFPDAISYPEREKAKSTKRGQNVCVI